jgi:DNA-binding LacI/PurR family transcriptional regulator
MLVPLFAGPFFLEVLRGVEAVLARSPYTLLIHTIATPEDRDQVFSSCCSRAGSDGVLVLWIGPTERFVQRLASEGILTVLMNVVGPRVWSVRVDHDVAAQQAVTYCLERGHRRIALVDRLEDPFDPSSRGICERGYRDTMMGAGLTPPGEYSRIADFSARGGAAALDALLALPEWPTAVIAGSDIQAVGIIEAARSRGWGIPAELSVIGYSDGQLAQAIGLTTVQVPFQEIGRRATEVLLNALAQPDGEPTSISLPTELVVRQTCGPPPRS